MTLTVVPDLVLSLGQLVCPVLENDGYVVPTPTDLWFPLPPTVTSLPPKPAYTTQPNLIPANSAIAGPCFDPDDVDVQQLFNNLIPPGDTPPVFDVSINPSVLIEARNLRIPVRFRLRSVIGVLYANYSLQPGITPSTITQKLKVTPISYRYKVTADGGSFTSVINNALLSFVLPIIAQVGSFALTGQSADLIPDFGPMTWDAGEFNVVSDADILVLSQFDTNLLDSSSYNISLAPLDSAATLPVIDNITTKFGAGSLYVASTAGTNASQGLQFYLNQDAAPSYSDDFTVAFWLYPDVGLGQEAVWGVDYSVQNLDGLGYLLILEEDVLDPDKKILSLASWEAGAMQYLISTTSFLDNGVWYHIALQRRNGVCALFVNGANVGTVSALFSLKNRHVLGNYDDVKTAFHFYQFNGYIDSFVISSSAVYPGNGFDIPAVPYSISSFDSANFSILLSLVADAGSYALAGQDAITEPLTYKGIAAGGSFSLVGYDALFGRPSRSFVATATPFTLTALASVDPPSPRGSASNSSGAGGITVTWPTVQVNDIAFLLLESDSNIKLPLLPPDWQQVPGSPQNTNSGTSGTALVVYWKRVTSLPQSSFTITDLGDHVLRSLSIWQGAKTTGTPFIGGNSGTFTTSATSHVVPAITTTGNNSRVLIFASTPIDSATPWGVTPTNSTLTDKNNQVTGTATGNGGGLQVFYGTKMLPGSSGSTTVNLASSSQMAYVSIELLAVS